MFRLPRPARRGCRSLAGQLNPVGTGKPDVSDLTTAAKPCTSRVDWKDPERSDPQTSCPHILDGWTGSPLSATASNVPESESGPLTPIPPLGVSVNPARLEGSSHNSYWPPDITVQPGLSMPKTATVDTLEVLKRATTVLSRLSVLGCNRHGGVPTLSLPQHDGEGQCGIALAESTPGFLCLDRAARGGRN